MSHKVRVGVVIDYESLSRYPDPIAAWHKVDEILEKTGGRIPRGYCRECEEADRSGLKVIPRGSRPFADDPNTSCAGCLRAHLTQGRRT